MRLGKSGELITGDAHAHFREAVYRGAVYCASVPVAGVAPGTALSTTPPLTIWNPPNSGVNADLLKVTMGYVSGTLGAGGMVYGQAAQLTTPTTGTVIKPSNALLGKLTQGQIQAFSGSTLAATPSLVAPAGFNLAASLATTAAAGFQWEDLIDGEFILTPGNVFIMQGLAAAGSTPLVVLSFTWEETPV
jgi:hypothetical protein